MYQVACPACGAQVSFRSAASVMAVCSYCQSTLLRDADSVRDIGKMSAVLEDYSRVRIGVSGVFEGNQFTVIGRIQLVYDDGYWNEWYAMFDDGSAGWLSEASGQYVFTRQHAQSPGGAPTFEQIVPGSRMAIKNVRYTASDVRTARCSGGEGELPFKVGEGWEARVADFRAGKNFLTLDYSDSQLPTAYEGMAVTLEALKCQLLRDAHEIEASAGKLPGSVANLECPNCGASIAYRAGIAQHLICQTCHAEVSAQGGKVEVLAKNEELERRTTTLSLGDVGSINGKQWKLIGLMECRETGSDDESSTWVEYLLHNANEGFRWIVESMEGWDLITVLDEWPEVTGARTVRYQNEDYEKRVEYGSVVTWAAGAFNWRVHIGDAVRIVDYRNGGKVLTMERGAQEIVWSRPMRVSPRNVLSWFGRTQEAAVASDKPVPLEDEGDIRAYCIKMGFVFSAILVLLNLPMMFRDGDAVEWSFFGLMALWFPVLKSDGSDSGDD